MTKLAWPSLSAHSSLGPPRSMAGISMEGTSAPGRFALLRWKEEIEGLLLSGGDGRPRSCGVAVESMGVAFPPKKSPCSATDGDCNGDCKSTSLFAEASIMRGGRSGVLARSSPSSAPFAFSISRRVQVERFSLLLPPKMDFVGVGGI